MGVIPDHRQGRCVGLGRLREELCVASTPSSATPGYNARTAGRHEVESLKQQGLVGLGAEEAAANKDAERKLTEFRDCAVMHCHWAPVAKAQTVASRSG